MARILVVDDEEGMREFLSDVLEGEGHSVTIAADGLAGSRRLDAESFHLVVTDLRMPGMDGMALVKKVRAEHPATEVIVLTAFGTVGGAVEAMKMGAYDYLQKPLQSPEELRLLVARALERVAMRNRFEATGAQEAVPRLTWGADSMKPVEEALRRVAPTQASVLLLGESGTGKEVAAGAIHAWSTRAGGPFVAINCAALAHGVVESELFGHERGAFTGARDQRRGRLELADGGTLFLDEIGELEASLQAKLLRVLQERRFERVGGTRTIEVDIRLVAATNRDLQRLVEEGTFRLDLYHRLAVFPVKLPALRDRRQDIGPLADLLLARASASVGRPGLALSPAARSWLETRPWPGNIREMANALERAAILCDGQIIEVEHLAGNPLGGAAQPGGPDTLLLDELERDAIERALQKAGGKRRQAAELLGIGERTLYDKLRRYGLG